MDSHIDSVYYDKPLPDRTKIDIWECYARHVLQFIDSNKYGNLTYSDKPDLIDRTQSLGIEVTDAQSRKTGKLNPSIPGSHTSITNLGNNAKSNESNNAARIMKAEY